MFDPNLDVEMGALAQDQQILHSAAAMREALAEHWLSTAEVGARLGGRPSTAIYRASQLRREGQLLGVYVTHPVPCYRYPTWQFLSDGQPVDHLAEILTLLRDYGPFHREPDGMRRTTGWGEVEWFLSSHVLLDGAQPATMLSADPSRVLHAARIEFGIDA